jgi:hypothetical protein
MATVDLTFSQIVDAVRQLPAIERERLLKEIDRLPRSDAARRAAQRIRGNYRLSATKRRRMSELLSKGNGGTLSADESVELDGLVEEFEQKTLEMAESLARKTKPRSSPKRPGPRR